MFYFDEDHMENGFDAPAFDDRFDCNADDDDDVDGSGGSREDGIVRAGGAGGGLAELGRRTAAGESPSNAGEKGEATITKNGTVTALSSASERRAAGNEMMASPKFARHDVDVSDEDLSSEGEEEPSELVPLGMRSRNGTFTGSSHRRRRGARTCFYDYYKLTDEHLGSGAYASVRTCVALATGREYAVKLVDKRNGHTRSRIMREVETFDMCKHHPNIVHLHEWFEDKDCFYMVFEKMRGGPLLNHIQRKVYFTEREAAQVTKDIANALKYLHDHGIAHRDVKPENILCTDPDRVSPVKLCDLDLASKASSPSPPLSTTKPHMQLQSVHSEPNLASPVGSAEFMAPEVVDAFVGDALKYDKRCDMWSLGVILYIMLCGYPPFYGECTRDDCGWDRGESCPDCQENLFARIQLGEFDFPDEEWCRVSDDVKDLISHLLVKNVRKRYTADDVLRHPWIQNGAPITPLETPGILFRNDSTRDVHQMQEHFNAVHRLAASGRLSSGGSEEELPATVLSPSAVLNALSPLESLDDTAGDEGEKTMLAEDEQSGEDLRQVADDENAENVDRVVDEPDEDDANVFASAGDAKQQQPHVMNGMMMMPQGMPGMQLPQQQMHHVATTTATGSNPAIYGALNPYLHPHHPQQGIYHHPHHHHHMVHPFHPSQLMNIPPGMVVMATTPNGHQIVQMPPMNLHMKSYPLVSVAENAMLPPLGTVYYAAPPMMMPPGMHGVGVAAPVGHFNHPPVQANGTVYYGGRYSAGEPLSAMPAPVYYHPHAAATVAAAMHPPPPVAFVQQMEMQTTHRPPTPMTPPVGLETCQTAMARQDSKSDLRAHKRETSVHV